MRFSCFCVLPGSAEALVRKNGKIKYHLTPYFRGNIPAKNYQNRSMHVEVKNNILYILYTHAIELLRHETPDFTGQDVWPANSPDLNPVD